MEYGPANAALGGKWVSNGGWFLFPLCVLSALAGAFLIASELLLMASDGV